MRYWLCVTNQENWEVMRGKNVWGVEERHRNSILKVKPGDRTEIKGCFSDSKVVCPEVFRGEGCFCKACDCFQGAEGICEIAGGVSNYGVRNGSQDQHL